MLIVPLLGVRSAAAGIGISPPFVNGENLSSGSRFSATIFIVQDDPNQDLNVHANFNIPPQTTSWFSTDKGLDFIIPKGVKMFPIEIRADIPPGVQVGKYASKLNINTTIDNKELYLSADINLTISQGSPPQAESSKPVNQPPQGNDRAEGKSNITYLLTVIGSIVLSVTIVYAGYWLGKKQKT